MAAPRNTAMPANAYGMTPEQQAMQYQAYLQQQQAAQHPYPMPNQPMAQRQQ